MYWKKNSIIWKKIIQKFIFGPYNWINYRIFWPITRALSLKKGSEIVKNEHARYTSKRFPTDNARVICIIFLCNSFWLLQHANCWYSHTFRSFVNNPITQFFFMVGHKHLPNRIARFFLCKTFRTVSAFRHSRTLLSPTLNSLPASRFPFSFATSTTSSLNLAVYDFLRELPVLPPSMGNSDANF